MNEAKIQTNLELKKVITEPYKYGFQTEIEKEEFPFGINEEIIKLISLKKNEPLFLCDFRLKALKKWQKMQSPIWANLKIDTINYDKITYYSIPKKKKKISIFR